jgi:hypothetical protein
MSSLFWLANIRFGCKHGTKLMEQCTSENINNGSNTNIYSYLETSGGQSYNLYLNVVHFFNPSVYYLWQLKNFVILHRSLKRAALLRPEKGLYREYYRGKYHCTVDLLFYWFGLICFANKNKNCQLSHS